MPFRSFPARNPVGLRGIVLSAAPFLTFLAACERRVSEVAPLAVGGTLEPQPMRAGDFANPFAAVDAAQMRWAKRSPLAPRCFGPVSLVRESDATVLFCDYVNVWRLWTDEPRLEHIASPEGVATWNPTGLVYLPGSRRLLVANYTGHDVLDCVLEGHELVLRERHTWPGLLSPEGVAVFPPDADQDFERMAVADFDASKVFVTDAQGRVQWSRPAPSAHGIAFSRAGEVWATAPGSAEILVFGPDGDELRRWGQQGWRREQYLWPMTLSLTPAGAMLLADAHVGAVCRLDGGFGERVRWGGNGPGVDAFNMPYGILALGEGRAIVADTYKRRLVWVDIDRGTIDDWVGLADDAPGHGARGVPSLAGAEHHALRLNLAQRVEIPLLADWGLPTEYRPAYSGLFAPGVDLAIPQQGGVFGGATYFVHATNAADDRGEEFALIFSPTSPRGVAIREDGASAVFSAGRNLWVQAPGVIVDDAGRPVTEDLLAEVREGISGATRLSPPTVAARHALQLDETQFYAALRSEPGRALATSLWAAPDRAAAALDVYLRLVATGAVAISLDEAVVVGALAQFVRQAPDAALPSDSLPLGPSEPAQPKGEAQLAPRALTSGGVRDPRGPR